MVDTEESLAIDQVYHEASIDIDETGTEAAPATAVVGTGVGGFFSDGEIEFIADRPFLFTIHDQTTGTILFGGRAVHPADWK